MSGDRRVVFVLEAFCAGSLTATRLMAWELARRGWAITVVHGRRPESPASAGDVFPPNTTFHELRWTPEIHIWRDVAAFRRLRRIFRELQPSIIHLVSSKAGAVGRLAAWPRFRNRVVYSPQGWSFLAGHRHPVARAFYRLVEWLAARLGGTIVACSEGERQLTRRFTQRSVVIENAVESPRAGITPAANRRPAPRLHIIGTMGRITQQKDPGFFVEVVRLVAREEPNVSFVWVGDGELQPILTAARKAGLPIAVTGWIPAADVAARLGEWRLYLQTSRYEGMPFAILEAFAAGLPVVARDVVGNRDAVRAGETGCLFASPPEAATALLRYLRDEGLWRRTSEAARVEAATRFSPARLGAELEAVYSDLLRRDFEGAMGPPTLDRLT